MGYDCWAMSELPEGIAERGERVRRALADAREYLATVLNSSDQASEESKFRLQCATRQLERAQLDVDQFESFLQAEVERKARLAKQGVE